MAPWEKYQSDLSGPWAKYGGASTTNDAVASPPPNSDFEIHGAGSQTAQGFTPQNLNLPPPGNGPDISLQRALLTNEPTHGLIEGFARSVPATAGAAMGAAAGGGLTAGLASVPGAMAGAAAGESTRQALAQAYAGLTGKPYSSPAQVVGNVGAQAAVGGLGQAGAVGLNNAGGYVVKSAQDKLAPTLKQYFGIAEPITKYVQGQGASQVFTPQNLNEGAALANVGGATADLAAARSATGKAIGSAENARLGNIGDKSAEVRHIREGLQDALYSRGITDPKTAGLARGKEVGILNNLLDTLTPSEGAATTISADGITRVPIADKLTLRQALNAKRLIDENLEFSDQLSKPTQALLGRVNGQIRDSVRSDMGTGVSNLWDDFGKIADAQSKLQEFTGVSSRSNVQQRAIQSLRGIILKNPGEVDNIVKVLGAGLPGGESQARNIFDSIAAEPFTKGGVGAPSNIILKGMAAIGATGGNTARAMVRGTESLANADFNPQALSYGLTSLEASPLASHYANLRTANP